MLIKRLKKLQENLQEPILIKKKENLQYLIGEDFNNVEGYLLVKPKPMNTNGKRINTDVVFFGSGLEKIIGIKKVDRFKNIGKYLNSKQLDIEYSFTYAEGKYLKEKLRGVKINPVVSPVSIQRQIKDSNEIAAVKKSMQIVERVFAKVKSELINTDRKRINTEAKLAKFITETGYKFGADDISFPAIVASGPNAAVPHHVASKKPLKSGESIIIDFGFKYKNYCSDFTRTVFLKTVPKKLEIAYNQVEKAYNESIEYINQSLSLRVQPKQSIQSMKRLPRRLSDALEAPRNDKFLTGNDVYQKSVDVLKEKHLEKYFIHSLGHGTGLEIHELPNLSPNSKDILKDNMVFSIEPGVYLPKLGGIRIEDLVYLENGKCKKFINVPTNLKSNLF